jgi:hypothetical protein
VQISRGIIQSALKITIYGPEGIGKTTFASKFPNPVFIDTEGSTKHMDVARLPKPTSWTMLIEEVKYVKQNPHICDTLVIDTADWAEQLCKNEVCAKAQKKGIEDFGYGKGYVYVAEEFGRLLNLLEDLIELGINIVLVAHAQMRKFEQPDELGAYDRWEMKMEKKVAPLVKEWADMLLFANYKTHVINVDGQGAQKGKNKVQGGKRVMYTTHHPCWDAKTRFDLLPELPFDFDEIRQLIPMRSKLTPAAIPPVISPPVQNTPVVDLPPVETVPDMLGNHVPDSIPKALADLMKANDVTVREIQQAVASRGYYPVDTPVENYDPNFISGVLVAAWPQVFKMIQDLRDEIPL